MADILLIERGDGGDIVFNNGDIAVDNTFYTAIYLSLFSGDAFHNIYVDNPTNKEFEDSLNQTITFDNLRNVEVKANSALDWMISKGLAQSITSLAYGNNDKQINVDITITEPTGDIRKFGVIWDNENLILKKYNEVY